MRYNIQYMVKIKKTSGFTLIELLVVISIISLLASIVLGSLSQARTKALDARRISSLREVQKAMELYAINNNGLYPYLSTEMAWACYYNPAFPHDDEPCLGIEGPPNLLSPYLKNLSVLVGQDIPPTFAFGQKAYASVGPPPITTTKTIMIGISANRQEYKIFMTGFSATQNIPVSLRDPEAVDDSGISLASIASSNAAKQWAFPSY
jgi:prepilin-type N-terminal cleavage/methylation domain-containing protein